MVDFYKRFKTKETTPAGDLLTSRFVTILWGAFCIVVALYASRLGNLIEAVNILGSLFYGTILGIFLTAFFLRWVGGKAVFYAAVVTEIFVVISWYNDFTAFLWLNLIGSLMVMFFAFTFQIFMVRKPSTDS